MRTIPILALWIVAAGCGDEVTTAPTGATTTTGATTSGAGGMTGSTTTTSTTTSAQGGSGQGGAAVGGGMGQGGNASPCAMDPADTMCQQCIKASCCMELVTCYANPDCACIADCTSMGGGLFMCAQQCMVTAPPPGAQELGSCIYGSCAQGMNAPCSM